MSNRHQLSCRLAIEMLVNPEHQAAASRGPRDVVVKASVSI